MTDTHAAAIEHDEQARLMVKHETGRTLFVEAGAGTGKTTALVGRIVQMVLDPDPQSRVPLASIAAITFTEAAAAELRERIRHDFEDALANARRSGDTDTARACEDALADADLAAISTLHAFAQRLLSEHPVDVGVPPRVDVIDEVQSQIAFEARWSEFVDQLFADPDIEEFVVRASILGVGIGDRRSPLRQVAQIFDDNWDRLEHISDVTPLAAPLDFTPVMDAALTVLTATADCSDPQDKLLLNIEKGRPTIERFLESHTDTERLRMLRRLKISAAHGKKGNWTDIDAVKGEIGALGQVSEALASDVANQTLRLLAMRIASFTREAAQDRRSEGTLEFHDLLVLARMLLRISPVARAALSSRYRVLMLDEFQDTDPIQIELALLLAGSVSGEFTGSWDELHADDGRLFMVGDPKQSIYRFRRADIDLFHAVQQRFDAGAVALTRNFRTVTPIIHAINAIFGERMTKQIAGQADYTALVPTREGTVDHRPAVFGGPAADTVKAGELRAAEAADVASIIAAIRSDPTAWPVHDKATDRWREPKLSDITVLLPTRTSLRQLSEALDHEQIPFRADTGTLVYETQEVRDLLTTLRAIDDPSDQIALVAALRSPLYACGDDDLFRWKHGGGAFDLRSAWPDELGENPVAPAILHLRELADLRWWDEPSRLLQRLVDDRRAFVLPASGRRPRDVWRRLRYLIDQARAFAESGGGDLRAYLKWTALQGVDGSKAHEPMLPELDDDAVQIMTIHGSKGLEFPITIVSGLTTDLGRSGAGGVEVVWTDPNTVPEVSLNKTLRTAQFDLSKDLESEMDRPEKERLLYVALTRARDHLILSAHHPTNKKGEPKDSHGATIHAFATGDNENLVRPALGQGTLFGASGPAPVPAAATPFRISPTWVAERRSVLRQASQTRVRSATALARQVRSDLDPHEDLAPHDEIDDATALPPQTFRRGRAGTAIGSAVHAVLQHVDLADPDAAVIDELVRSQAWAESVPEHVDTIARSVRSALDSEIVRSCSTNRHWKELYVAAPVAGLTVEGYVDLLVERADGLVVVDYKTDSVSSEADIDEKLDGYAMQGAAYAVAVETATGHAVADVQFVFARPQGPVVRSVANLPELRKQITQLAMEPPADEPESLH
jgi:ATP-dependent exoDNAse (exonuclease V) beta subunit